MVKSSVMARGAAVVNHRTYYWRVAALLLALCVATTAGTLTAGSRQAHATGGGAEVTVFDAATPDQAVEASARTAAPTDAAKARLAKHRDGAAREGFNLRSDTKLASAHGGFNTAATADVPSAPPVDTFGTCSTPGCGGELMNHSDFYVTIANHWCSGSSADVVAEHLSCVRYWNNANAFPADYWLHPNHHSSRYPFYYDVDAFRAAGNCVTKFTRWVGPLLLGGYTYDRRGKGSVWIKISNAEFIDVVDVSCLR
ncbi:hypothetical protein [Actinoplanes aureus]|uniref:Uncharacterized protein n=1 Tax=Actinoplanes aureus TaxID=2792083 RepID=A0A931G2K7_9ACTN|nr:hypothetical protein [Actinoplanes aureus]MBG0567822.1 hypothetical protein [Actinoplanes aureus]